MYKKRNARAELLFCSLNLSFFDAPLPSSSWFRKVPPKDATTATATKTSFKK